MSVGAWGRTARVLAALVVLGVGPIGCARHIDGDPGAAQTFDPCGVLDLQALVADGTVPAQFAYLTRSLDVTTGRLDTCAVGGQLGVLRISVVVGEQYPEVAQVVPSFARDNGAHTEVDGRAAYASETNFGRYLAIDSGPIQLLLESNSLGGTLGKDLDTRAMVDLAAAVLPRLPASIEAAPVDLPAECAGLRGIEAVVGSVERARGARTERATTCAYAGGHGVLEILITPTDARSVVGADIRNNTDSGPKFPVVAPPIAPETVTYSYDDYNGLTTRTYVDERYYLSTRFIAADEVPLRSIDIDDDERALIESAVAVARSLD